MQIFDNGKLKNSYLTIGTTSEGDLGVVGQGILWGTSLVKGVFCLLLKFKFWREIQISKIHEKLEN